MSSSRSDQLACSVDTRTNNAVSGSLAFDLFFLPALLFFIFLVFVVMVMEEEDFFGAELATDAEASSLYSSSEAWRFLDAAFFRAMGNQEYS